MYNKPLQRSHFLQVTQLEDVFGVWHSILGNFRICDEEMIKTLSDLENITDVQSQAISDSSIEKFKKLGYITGFKSPEDERHHLLQANRFLKRQTIQGVQLVLHTECGMGCDYCYQNDLTKYSPLMTKMDLKVVDTSIEFLLFLDSISKKDCYSVHLFGGEPLLNKEAIKYYYQQVKSKKLSDRIITKISTNGLYLTNELIDFFEKEKTALSINIMHPQSPFFSVKNDLIYHYLAQKNMNITLSIAICHSNFDQITEKLIDSIYNMGFRHVGVNIDFSGKLFKKYSPAIVADRIFELYKYSKKLGLLFSGYWYEQFSQLIDNDLEDFIYHRGCNALGFQLSVMPNGDIFACGSTSEKIANIHEENFEKIIGSKSYINYKHEALNRREECISCEIEGFCFGTCLCTKEDSANLANANYFCDYQKRIMKRMIDFTLENDRAI